MNRARDILARPTMNRAAVIVAVLFAAPSLFYGFVIDDRLQRQAALGRSKLYDHGPFDLFGFVPGGPEHTLRLIEHGLGAWWSDVHARIVFLRPISSGMMWLDYRLLRDPVAIHAHSILWYAVAVTAAGALYRRWIDQPWIAGLAALLFAVDPNHGLLVAWIAQRNALVAGVLGLSSLLLHDRAMREGRAWLDVAASVCLGLALLSAEAALGVVPYLVAHAFFLDRRRLRGLVPFVPTLIAWACIYKLGGYGAHRSGLYVDPLHHPTKFLENVVTHGPLLVATALGLPGADLFLLLGTAGKITFVSAALLVCAAFVMALRPLLARDPVVRFFAAGAILSVIPACAVMPGGRLLFFASFGVVGALARLFAAWRDHEVPRGAWTRAVVYLAAAFHLYLAPVLFELETLPINVVDRILVRTADGLPDVPEIEAQRLVVVNPPDATFCGYLAPIQSDRGRHAPDRVLAMAAGVRPLELIRTSDTTLTLSSSVALVQPGSDLLIREDRPFEIGHRVTFSDVTIEITRVNADGWPTEARFEFTRPLEDPSLRFMQWQDQTLKPLALPSVGERVVFPAQRIRIL